jgi:HD-GYP domain-containing protein (c-di-GMP phosphodiesterase class II)
VLILPIEDAAAGMRLAAPVYHPAQVEQELLRRGYVLERNVLDRLRSLGVGTLAVDWPGLEDLDRHLAPTLSPARQKLYEQIKETISANQRRMRPAVSFTDYYATTRELVLSLLGNGTTPIYVEVLSRLGSSAIGHAAAVAHLSLVLGLKLETYLIEQRSRLPPRHAREVVNLGVAGMLHDMGKLKLPPNQQGFDVFHEPPDEPTLAGHREHAALGYEMIRRGVEPSAAAAVLHHHQRFDGSGFPSLPQKTPPDTPLAGTDIHVFGRILAMADGFDRLTTPIDGSPRRSNLLAIRDLRTKYAHWFDPKVLATLAVVAPPFLPGTRVTLSDGTLAAVSDVEPNAPFRPAIRRIGDDPSAPPGEVVRLVEHPELAIERADGLDVRAIVEELTVRPAA